MGWHVGLLCGYSMVLMGWTGSSAHPPESIGSCRLSGWLMERRESKGKREKRMEKRRGQSDDGDAVSEKWGIIPAPLGEKGLAPVNQTVCVLSCSRKAEVTL